MLGIKELVSNTGLLYWKFERYGNTNIKNKAYLALEEDILSIKNIKTKIPNIAPKRLKRESSHLKPFIWKGKENKKPKMMQIKALLIKNLFTFKLYLK